MLKHLNLERYIDSKDNSEVNKEEVIEVFEPAKVDYDEINGMAEEYFYNLHGISSTEWLSEQIQGRDPIIPNVNHEYWLNRGISINTIAKMAVGCGADSRGFFYSVPYFWCFDNDMTKIEPVAIKKIYPHQAKEGKKDSYGIYPSVPTLLYHQMAILYARKFQTPLIVFEGEKDLIMGVEQGLIRTAVAIPGKSTFKSSLIPLFWGLKKLILFLDNDADDSMDQIIRMFDKYRDFMPLPVVEKFDWTKYDLPKGGDFTDLVNLNQFKGSA